MLHQFPPGAPHIIGMADGGWDDFDLQDLHDIDDLFHGAAQVDVLACPNCQEPTATETLHDGTALCSVCGTVRNHSDTQLVAGEHSKGALSQPSARLSESATHHGQHSVAFLQAHRAVANIDVSQARIEQAMRQAAGHFYGCWGMATPSGPTIDGFMFLFLEEFEGAVCWNCAMQCGLLCF